MKFVLISGSARVDSFNTALLKNFAKLLKPKDSYFLFDKNFNIPIFSPAIEGQCQIPVLNELVSEIKSADFVLFSTPEYIHGLPGGLKNLLDWLVGTAVLDNKKTGFIIATSSSGEFALPQLKEILNVMTNQNVIDEAVLVIPGIKTKFNSDLDLIDEEVKLKLNNVYETLSKYRTK